MILVVLRLPTRLQLLAERREAFNSFRVWRLPGWPQVSQCTGKEENVSMSIYIGNCLLD